MTKLFVMCFLKCCHSLLAMMRLLSSYVDDVARILPFFAIGLHAALRVTILPVIAVTSVSDMLMRERDNEQDKLWVARSYSGVRRKISRM